MFNHGMRIVSKNRITPNVRFELMDGTRIWYTDMSTIQRGHADKLLAAQQGVYLTVCGRCGNQITEKNVYCPKCGQWNPANRR